MLWKKLLVDKAKDEESLALPTNYNQNEAQDLYVLENEENREMGRIENNEESVNNSISEESFIYEEDRPPSTVKSSLERAEGEWKGKDGKRMAKSHTEALILCEHNEESASIEEVKSLIEKQYQTNCKIVIDRTVGVYNNEEEISKIDWNVEAKKMVKGHFQVLCTKIATEMIDDRSIIKDKNGEKEKEEAIVFGCEEIEKIQETLCSSEIIRKEDNEIISKLVKEEFSKRSKLIIENLCLENNSIITNNINEEKNSTLLIKEQVQKAFKKSCESILNQLHFDTTGEEKPTKITDKSINEGEVIEVNNGSQEEEQNKINMSEEESILSEGEKDKEEANLSLEKEKQNVLKSKANHSNEVEFHNRETAFHELGFEMPIDDFIKQIEEAGIDVADLASNEMSRNEKSRENEDFLMKELRQLKINRYSSDNYEFDEVINTEFRTGNAHNNEKMDKNRKKYEISINLLDIRAKIQEIAMTTTENIKKIQNYTIDSQKQFSDLFDNLVSEKQKEIDKLKERLSLKESIIQEQQQENTKIKEEKEELIETIFDINQKLAQSDLYVEAQIQEFINKNKLKLAQNTKSEEDIRRLTEEVEELTKICQNSQISQKRTKESEKLSLSIELERISRREALLQQRELEMEQNINLVEEEKLRQSMYIAELNQRDREIHEAEIRLKEKLIKIEELEAELTEGFANVEELKIEQEIKNQKLEQEEEAIVHQRRRLDEGMRSFITRERAATQYEGELLRNGEDIEGEFSNGRSREYLNANNFDAYERDYEKINNGLHNQTRPYNEINKLQESPGYYSKLQFNQKNHIKSTISPHKSHLVVKSSHSPVNGRLPSEMNKKDKFGNSLANKSSQNTLPYPKFRESMPSKLKSPYFNPTQKKVADYKLNDLGSRIDNLRNEIRMEINATTKGQ